MFFLSFFSRHVVNVSSKHGLLTRTSRFGEANVTRFPLFVNVTGCVFWLHNTIVSLDIDVFIYAVPL